MYKVTWAGYSMQLLKLPGETKEVRKMVHMDPALVTRLMLQFQSLLGIDLFFMSFGRDGLAFYHAFLACLCSNLLGQIEVKSIMGVFLNVSAYRP